MPGDGFYHSHVCSGCGEATDCFNEHCSGGLPCDSCDACDDDPVDASDDDGPPCICAEHDGRGRSCCGVECSVHPLNGKCPKCGLETHGGVKCINCAYKDGEY